MKFLEFSNLTFILYHGCAQLGFTITCFTSIIRTAQALYKQFFKSIQVDITYVASSI